MKRLDLSEDERRTLREMGVFHPHARTRMRAQGILRLSQGLTLQETADEFGVHLNSVEQWRQRWNKLGLYRSPQKNGHANSSRFLARWRIPRAEAWAHCCCARLHNAATMCRSVKARLNGISRR